ncbi:MAG: hypothetical protein BWY63_01498 [Chloroflexi bacterium ADurb.Bin360]|nr:MAG: hypothetical protein BWY63_01498 [Chloroflexi bacterium ADurb.Bin360]
MQRFVIYNLVNPPTQEGLPRILHAHVWSVGICHAQAYGAQAVDAVIDHVIPFAGNLIHPVDICRRERMFLIHRQVLGLAVNLPGAGEDNLHPGVELPAGFQDRDLAAAVDFQIRERIDHAIQMTHLSGEIEQIILILDQVIHAMGVTHIGDVHPHAVLNFCDVEEIAAVIRDQGIHQQHIRTQIHQSVRQMTADEAQSTGD